VSRDQPEPGLCWSVLGREAEVESLACEVGVVIGSPSFIIYASKLFKIIEDQLPDSHRLAPSLSRMGFDRVYPVYYEISFELETENERDL
jgi:hypothetical protein